MQITPSGQACGASVSGVDLRQRQVDLGDLGFLEGHVVALEKSNIAAFVV